MRKETKIQLDFLEQELKMMQENIQRLKTYTKEYESSKRTPSTSRVVGELKHRIICLKQRLTSVSNITTTDIF